MKIPEIESRLVSDIPESERIQLRDRLRRLAPQHPLLTAGWPQVQHTEPLRPFGRIPEGEPVVWFEVARGPVLSLHYEQGQLKSALTQGDGLLGEDLLPNVVMVGGVPRELSLDHTMRVWGVVSTTENLDVDTCLRHKVRADAQVCRRLVFRAFNVTGRFESEMEKFCYLAGLGVPTANHGFDLSRNDLTELRRAYDEEQIEPAYPLTGLGYRIQSAPSLQSAILKF